MSQPTSILRRPNDLLSKSKLAQGTGRHSLRKAAASPKKSALESGRGSKVRFSINPENLKKAKELLIETTRPSEPEEKNQLEESKTD